MTAVFGAYPEYSNWLQKWSKIHNDARDKAIMEQVIVIESERKSRMKTSNVRPRKDVQFDVMLSTTSMEGFESSLSSLSMGESALEFAIAITRCIEELVNVMQDWYKVIHIGAVDILDGQKISDTTRIHKARQLKKFLNTQDVYFESASDQPDKVKKQKVIIEEQCAAINNSSASIMDQLCLYYADYDVVLANPSAKKVLQVSSQLTRENIKGLLKSRLQAKADKAKGKPVKVVSNAKLSYSVNKLHSKLSMYHIAYITDNLPAIYALPKGFDDDVGDSIVQTMTHILYKRV